MLFIKYFLLLLCLRHLIQNQKSQCFLVDVLDHVIRSALGFFKTIPTIDIAPGAAGNLPLLFIAIVLFITSMRYSRSQRIIVEDSPSAQ